MCLSLKVPIPLVAWAKSLVKLGAFLEIVIVCTSPWLTNIVAAQHSTWPRLQFSIGTMVHIYRHTYYVVADIMYEKQKVRELPIPTYMYIIVRYVRMVSHLSLTSRVISEVSLCHFWMLLRNITQDSSSSSSCPRPPYRRGADARLNGGKARRRLSWHVLYGY